MITIGKRIFPDIISAVASLGIFVEETKMMENGYICPDGTFININNIPEAEELIKKYRNITREDLKSKSLFELTGFGSFNTCTLCIGVGKGTTGLSSELDDNRTCTYCIWAKSKLPKVVNELNSDVKCLNSSHYDITFNSGVKNFDAVVDLLKERADIIEKLIRRKE